MPQWATEFERVLYLAHASRRSAKIPIRARSATHQNENRAAEKNQSRASTAHKDHSKMIRHLELFEAQHCIGTWSVNACIEVYLRPLHSNPVRSSWLGNSPLALRPHSLAPTTRLVENRSMPASCTWTLFSGRTKERIPPSTTGTFPEERFTIPE